jgi:SRSO17 transposase
MDLAYYLCFGPTSTADEDLIRVAGTRWAIEECFQTAKTEVGLDHYQVRRYNAWYRHITLVLCAHAYLAVTAAQAKKGVPKPMTASSPSPSGQGTSYPVAEFVGTDHLGSGVGALGRP